MGERIRPLSNSQKLFLQRLMAAHVLTDDQTQSLYQSIQSNEEYANAENNQGYMGRNLNHCLGIINASLVPAFNLEIRTVALPRLHDTENNEEEEEEENDGRRSSRSRKSRALIRYHAVVNRSNDAFAQKYASPLAQRGPHELAYIRLVLERLVERGLEFIEDGSCDTQVGCPGVLSRMHLINLRTELEGAHKDKLTIAQTEQTLAILETEGWLVFAAPPPQKDDDTGEEQEQENDDEERVGSQTRKKRHRPSSSGANRRKSLRGTFYGIGPRSFMELEDFLQNAGLPQDRMPQSILHHA